MLMARKYNISGSLIVPCRDGFVPRHDDYCRLGRLPQNQFAVDQIFIDSIVFTVETNQYHFF
jgi:hypothetical protein